MDLLIVTHRPSLVALYGATGEAAIIKHLDDLVADYLAAGVLSEWLSLDDATVLGALAQTTLASRKGFKQAIDKLVADKNPGALWIVGGPDVVPFQRLNNPLWAGATGGDPDQYVMSDLPYASPGVFGNEVSRYTAIDRVVARVGDQGKSTNPNNLIAMLRRPGVWTAGEEKDYFALSAEVWKKSTQLSLSSIFGRHTGMKTSPADGPVFPSAALASKTHFINCHGGPYDPRFQGQRGRSYPDALRTVNLGGLLPTDLVAAFECCYGAQLYDQTTSVAHPICVEYLLQKAAGLVGSTSVSYGPPATTDNADLICSYFLAHVHLGESLGEAFLSARQQYITYAKRNRGALDPTDLKTLGQFVLYGNPLARPVQTSAPHTSVAKSSPQDPPRAKSMRQVARLMPAEDLAFAEVMGQFGVVPDDDLLVGWRVTNLLTVSSGPSAGIVSLAAKSATKKAAPGVPAAHILFLTRDLDDTPPKSAEALLVINEDSDGNTTRRLLLRK